jgi:hypothetical protein
MVQYMYNKKYLNSVAFQRATSINVLGFLENSQTKNGFELIISSDN